MARKAIEVLERVKKAKRAADQKSGSPRFETQKTSARPKSARPKSATRSVPAIAGAGSEFEQLTWRRKTKDQVVENALAFNENVQAFLPARLKNCS